MTTVLPFRASMNTSIIHSLDTTAAEQTFTILQLFINKQTFEHSFIRVMNSWWQPTCVCWRWARLTHLVSLTIQQLSLCRSGNSLWWSRTPTTPRIHNEAKVYDSALRSLFTAVNKLRNKDALKRVNHARHVECLTWNLSLYFGAVTWAGSVYVWRSLEPIWVIMWGFINIWICANHSV